MTNGRDDMTEDQVAAVMLLVFVVGGFAAFSWIADKRAKR